MPMIRPTLIATLGLLVIGGLATARGVSAAQPSYEKFQVCGMNTGLYVARMKVTFYTGKPGESEQRSESAWITIGQSWQCQEQTYVRAFNITIQSSNGSSWSNVCDINRRPVIGKGFTAQSHGALGTTGCQGLVSS